MDTPRAPMETLFQSLRYLRGVTKYDFSSTDPAPVALVKDLVDLFVARGEFDASEPVGPHAMPWVHALALEREVPVDWLAYFAKDPVKSLVFSRIDGATVGSIAFSRVMKDADVNHSPTLLWWIENVPGIDEPEASGWVESLSKVKSPPRDYQGDAVKHAQALIAALHKRGVGLPPAEPGRPQERWSTKKVWWERLRSEGRLDEMVQSPSGVWRKMSDLMGLVGLDDRSGFAFWLNAQEDLRPPPAPHGRRRELLEDWVLGDPGLSISPRAQRLASSIDKTEGVLDELDARCLGPRARQPDHRNQLKALLSHRTPSGMSLRAWFFLSQEDKKDWPVNAKAVMDAGFDELQDWWLGPDGAGLVLQKLRAATECGAGEYPGFSRKVSSLHRYAIGDNYHTAMSGDPSTHAEMVDLMVDALVAPVSNRVAVELCEMVLSNGWVEDVGLNRKLEQALRIRLLRVLTRNPNASKAYDKPSNKELARNAARELVDDIRSGDFSIALSARDWGTLFSEWSMDSDGSLELGPEASAAIGDLFHSLSSVGSRLALAEQTLANGGGQPTRSRPRL